MNISEHFTLEEMTISETAIRRGIANTPGVVELNNLKRTASIMEEVRSLLGSPIRISSGYRCLALNRAIGSGDNSAHVKGLAIDFTCPGFGTPKEICKKIASSSIKFDQLIYEGTWVHIGLRIGEPRRQVMTAVFGGKKTNYLSGIV